MFEASLLERRLSRNDIKGSLARRRSNGDADVDLSQLDVVLVQFNFKFTDNAFHCCK